MPKAIVRLIIDRKGSVAVEYSLLISALAIGLISVISSLAETLGGIYQTILSGVVLISSGISG